MRSFIATPSSLAIALCLLFAADARAIAGDDVGWPQWGGPQRNFVVSGAALPQRWPSGGPRELWRRPLGAGYSGIAVQNGRLFTMLRRGGDELVLALDQASGETLWEHGYAAPAHVDQVKDFGKGPNATPLVTAGKVYTVGFTSRLICLDARTGNERWSHDLVAEFRGRIQPFGYASSPLRHEDMVIVMVGGELHGAMGFDLEDGSVLWQSDPLDFSYASPLIVDVDGEDQLVVMTPTGVVGVGLSDGRLRWEYHHENRYGTNCQGPWWGDDGLLFVSAHADAGSRTLRLTRGKDGTRVDEIHRDKELRIFHSNAVRVGEQIYGVSESRLIAHHIRSGEQAWSRSGFPGANLVYAAGKLVLIDESGKLTLAEVSPQGLDARSSRDILGKPAWTAPSLVGTRLYARDTESIVALELGPARPAAAAAP